MRGLVYLWLALPARQNNLTNLMFPTQNKLGNLLLSGSWLRTLLELPCRKIEKSMWRKVTSSMETLPMVYRAEGWHLHGASRTICK